jgi:hypothetical protein
MILDRNFLDGLKAFCICGKRYESGRSHLKPELSTGRKFLHPYVSGQFDPRCKAWCLGTLFHASEYSVCRSKSEGKTVSRYGVNNTV